MCVDGGGGGGGGGGVQSCHKGDVDMKFTGVTTHLK